MIEKWITVCPAVGGEQERRAYVYLPTMYNRQPERRFPVLYMFDGQNVFFNEDATFGKSWGMKEYLDYTDTPLIVAAVECNPGVNNERIKEYSPFTYDDWKKFGHIDGMGKVTLDWFINQFKPEVDKRFRTIPDRKHTFIGGSSMGGLMSLYAVLAHNDTFSRGAALSPSLWAKPDRLARLITQGKYAPDTVLYMDYGSREYSPKEKDGREGTLEAFANTCRRLLKRGVFLTSRIVPDGEHNEASWERQLPLVITTLMYGIER